jgi:hypothetical protein
MRAAVCYLHPSSDSRLWWYSGEYRGCMRELKAICVTLCHNYTAHICCCNKFRAHLSMSQKTPFIWPLHIFDRIWPWSTPERTCRLIDHYQIIVVVLRTWLLYVSFSFLIFIWAPACDFVYMLQTRNPYQLHTKHFELHIGNSIIKYQWCQWMHARMKTAWRLSPKLRVLCKIFTLCTLRSSNHRNLLYTKGIQVAWNAFSVHDTMHLKLRSCKYLYYNHTMLWSTKRTAWWKLVARCCLISGRLMKFVTLSLAIAFCQFGGGAWLHVFPLSLPLLFTTVAG